MGRTIKCFRHRSKLQYQLCKKSYQSKCASKLNQMRSTDLEFRQKKSNFWYGQPLNQKSSKQNWRNNQNVKLYKAKFFHQMVSFNKFQIWIGLPFLILLDEKFEFSGLEDFSFVLLYWPSLIRRKTGCFSQEYLFKVQLLSDMAISDFCLQQKLKSE